MTRRIFVLLPIVGAVVFGIGVPSNAQVPPGQVRVTICHRPPGNPANGQTLTLPQPAANAHLREHPFDTVGPCPPGTPPIPPGTDTSVPIPEDFGFGAPGVGSADASGGDGGSARGGDGGRGGSGTAPVCNQNSSDVQIVDYYDEWGNYVYSTEEPTVNCAAGGRGGAAGDGGISEGGDGGIGFDVG